MAHKMLLLICMGKVGNLSSKKNNVPEVPWGTTVQTDLAAQQI